MSTRRVGTWNLDGRFQAGHRRLLEQAACDVWLLTEVPAAVQVAGLSTIARTPALPDGRSWAAVLAAGGQELASPHPATAAARVAGRTFWCSVLPWRGSGASEPWPGADHAARLRAVVDLLLQEQAGPDLVWGGDWNHALHGPERAGSAAGRDSVRDALTRLGLHVPTATLAHPIEGLFSIDHIATSKPVLGAHVVPAVADDVRRLSDHDAYVVEFADDAADRGTGSVR